MGLETANQNPIGRIDPSSIVSRAGDVVNPSAVEMLTDSFRKGFITADDIKSRIEAGPVNTEKAKLDLQRMKEDLSPEAVDMRKNQRAAASAEAKGAAKVAPVAATAKESELKASILDAQMKGSGVLEMQNALTKAGWAVPIDPNKGFSSSDQQEIQRRFGVLLNFFTEKAKADTLDKDTEVKNPEIEVTDASGAVVKGPSNVPLITHKGQSVPVEKYKQLQQYKTLLTGMTPAAFDALGQPKAPDFFGAAGQVQAAKPAAPAAPTPPQTVEDIQAINTPPVQPKIEPMAPAATQAEAIQRDAELSKRLPGFVEPKTAEKPVVEPMAGKPFGSIGMVTGVKATPAEKPVHMTGEQQKGLSQAALTSDQFKEMEQAFKTLSTKDAWLTGPVMGRIMSWTAPENWNANYASFDRAKTAILANLAKGIYHETGVLSDKDIERYGRAMPTVKDTPEAAQAKLIGVQKDIFSSIINNIGTMRGQGQNISPLIQQMEQSAQQSLQNLGSSAAGSTPSGAGAGPVITLATGRRVQRGPDGQYYPAQ